MNPESNGIGLCVCKKIAVGLGGDLIHVPRETGCQFDLILNLNLAIREEPRKVKNKFGAKFGKFEQFVQLE